MPDISHVKSVYYIVGSLQAQGSFFKGVWEKQSEVITNQLIYFLRLQKLNMVHFHIHVISQKKSYQANATYLV